MKKKITALAFAGASLGMFVSAPTASAGHCVVVDADGNVTGDTPGFSYFGTDHVKDSDHNEGNNEDNPHTPGASNCSDLTIDENVSPSERAPGRNR